MRRLILFVVLAYIELVNVNFAHSDTFDVELLINKLSVWLEKAYDFKKDNIVNPSIEIVSEDILCKITFKEIDRINKKINCEKLLGLYDYNEKIIYISKSVDLNKKKGEAIVLHELVHHYQFECGLTDNISCLADLEELSLKMERKYLSEQN